jgi:hypothetical protein
MVVLIECPGCYRRLSVKSKRCETKMGKGCECDLDKAKKNIEIIHHVAPQHDFFPLPISNHGPGINELLPFSVF